MSTIESTEVPVATVEKKKTSPAAPAEPKRKRTFAAGARADGSLTIAAPDLAKISQDQGVAEYWCGASPDSLLQNIDVAGVHFPRWTNIPQVAEKPDENGDPVFMGGRPDLGHFVELTDAQVERFIKKVQRRVLRKFGDRRGLIIDIDHPNYRAMPDRDRPLGAFIYMVPTSEMGPSTRKRYPKPLICEE